MKGKTYDDAVIVLSEQDTVATALEDLAAGRTFTVGSHTVELVDDIEFGHKFALEPMEAGAQVRKYDEVIGEATEAIEAGAWVHTHNLQSLRGRPTEEAES